MKKLVDRSFVKEPATHGGKGWRTRHGSLRDEIVQGNLWHPCGYVSESGPLKEVVLHWPGIELCFEGPANEMLMLDKPELTTIRQQVATLSEFYRSQGVEVHFYKGSEPPPPNFLFQRDLFWATPEGVVLARPAALQRAGEERYALEALARIGVPITMSFRGTATFEGADAIWLNPKEVMVGTGVRTNREATRQLTIFLRDIEVEVIEIPLPHNCQHLLGIVNFVDEDLAIVHGGKATPLIFKTLLQRGIKSIVLPVDYELTKALGMNFVTLAPKKIVMPSGAPGIRGKLEANGIEVHEVDVSEYLKAAGGIACLTGILRRGDEPANHIEL